MIAITEGRKSEVLELIKGIEKSITENNKTNSSIATICEIEFKKSEELLTSTDSLAPILRTALVINWREAAMKSRYDRFRKLFPSILDLQGLMGAIESTTAFEFCANYLNINPNPLKPEANPKYALLRTLTKGFLEYQETIRSPTEIDALRHWATKINLSNLKDDFIGKRKGVGIGVVENIRLNLGYSVIKPDRHVIGVMKYYLKIDIPFEQYNDLSALLGLNPRYLDCILFEYGKLKGIST